VSFLDVFNKKMGRKYSVYCVCLIVCVQQSSAN